MAGEGRAKDGRGGKGGGDEGGILPQLRVERRVRLAWLLRTSAKYLLSDCSAFGRPAARAAALALGAAPERI